MEQPEAAVAEPQTEDAEEEKPELQGPSVPVSAGTRYGDKDPETNQRPKVEAEITIFPGADLTQAVEMYGEDTVFDDYKRSVERRASNAIRSSLNKHLDAGASPDQIPDLVIAELADWRPDSDRRPSRKSPEENILSNFASLPEEKQREIIARLSQAADNGAE